MIELKIMADNAEHLAEQVNGLRGFMALETAPGPIDEVAEPIETRSARKTNSAGGGGAGEAGAQHVEYAGVQHVEYADIQAAVVALATAKGRDAVMAVFGSFGVDHGTKLPEEQWPDALAALQSAKEA